MALLKVEGFEGAGTTTGSGSGATLRDYIKSRYIVDNTFREGTNDSVRIVTGWGSGFALSWGGDTNADLNRFDIPLGGEFTEAIVGFAYQPRTTLEDVHNIMAFYTSTQEETQCELRVYENQHLICYNDQFNRINESIAMGALRPGRWHYIEIRMRQSATVGQIEIHVNGEQLINATNLDTQGDSGETFFDTIRFLGGEASSTTVTTEQVLIDDIYILDVTGAAPTNTFLGPTKVEGLFPTAEGATINFTPSTGTNNAALVDENPKNDDTDYNSSTDTASNKDLFAAGNLSTITGTIYGVQITAQARSTNGFPVGLQCIVAEGTPTQGTGNVIEVSTDSKYLSVQHLFEDNPDTAAAWVVAEVNGMEIGYEID